MVIIKQLHLRLQVKTLLKYLLRYNPNLHPPLWCDQVEVTEIIINSFRTHELEPG